MTPKFSVAIPVFNRADYLRQAIASCLRQTVESLEVVVSDDCSSDDLAAVAAGFADGRVRHHRSGVRLGAAANHQRAVSLARGEYVITLNSDDMLLPDCLEVAGRELDRAPAAAAVYFACAYLGRQGPAGTSRIPAVGFADSAALAREPWLHKFHGTGPSCCLFRKERFDGLGGYRTSLRLAYDWDLYVRFLTAGGGVVFAPEALCVYRLHDEQMVQTSSVNGLWDMLDLWPGADDAHWSAKDLSGLVLAQCALKLRAGEGPAGVLALLGELSRRKASWRLLRAMPGAIWERARRGRDAARARQPELYVEAANAAAAVEQAQALVAAIATAGAH